MWNLNKWIEIICIFHNDQEVKIMKMIINILIEEQKYFKAVFRFLLCFVKRHRYYNGIVIYRNTL